VTLLAEDGQPAAWLAGSSFEACAVWLEPNPTRYSLDFGSDTVSRAASWRAGKANTSKLGKHVYLIATTERRSLQPIVHSSRKPSPDEIRIGDTGGLLHRIQQYDDHGLAINRALHDQATAGLSDVAGF
jgi:hypothetical protein